MSTKQNFKSKVPQIMVLKFCHLNMMNFKQQATDRKKYSMLIVLTLFNKQQILNYNLHVLYNQFDVVT